MQTNAFECLVYGVARPVQREPGEVQVSRGDSAYHGPVVVVVAGRERHGRHVSGAGMVMTFNPDDPHDGHAAGQGGFTYRMVHIWPEFFASLIGARCPLPLFCSPVIDDPVTARALRDLHVRLTGPGQYATELERYERLTATAALLVRPETTPWPGTRSNITANPQLSQATSDRL